MRLPPTSIVCAFATALVALTQFPVAGSAQQWPAVEIELAPIVRGQDRVAQAPIVYFDQDPNTAVLGPVPAGAPTSPMAGYGAAGGGNMLPMGFNNQYLGVFGEFLYLHPRGADVSYAVPQDGTGGIGTVPTGEVAVANIGYTPAFRGGAFFTIGDDALIELTYTRFESDATSSITSTAPIVINPLTLFPGTFNAGFTAEAASASYAIDYQLIDADYMVMGECCPDYWFGYLAGARYAELGQTFSATYPFAAPDGTTQLNTDINFSGAGLRLGLLGERTLFPNMGLRVYGSGVANLLVGKFDATYTQTNQFNGVEANTSISEDRIVPVLDLELGVAWLGPNGHFRISAGYLVSAWFNTVTTPSWIEGVQNRSFSPGDDVLTFDGLTARAQLAF